MAYKILFILVSVCAIAGFLSSCLWWARPEVFESDQTDPRIGERSKKEESIDLLERRLAKILVRIFLISLSLSIVVYIGISING